MQGHSGEKPDENPPRLPWETPRLQRLGDILTATRGGLGQELESGGAGATFEMLTS